MFLERQDNVNTFENVYQDYNDSFEYCFIDYKQLTVREKQIYDTKEFVINYFKAKLSYRSSAKIHIKISETIKVDAYGSETNGVYDFALNSIIIKRKVLESQKEFLAVLSHELIHYFTGYPDNDRRFENVLTELVGLLFDDLLNKH